LVQENFDFYVRTEVNHSTHVFEVHVVVKGTVVTLYGAKSRLCAGIWDSGGYVRYANATQLDVHPAILDQVDLKLRQKMTTKGDVFRVHPPRRSAVGYSG
jgi:hypothetical protein